MSYFARIARNYGSEKTAMRMIGMAIPRKFIANLQQYSGAN